MLEGRYPVAETAEAGRAPSGTATSLAGWLLRALMLLPWAEAEAHGSEHSPLGAGMLIGICCARQADCGTDLKLNLEDVRAMGGKVSGQVRPWRVPGLFWSDARGQGREQMGYCNRNWSTGSEGQGMRRAVR